MVEKYQGIPKKIKVYADADGNQYKMGVKTRDEKFAVQYTGSGTLLNAGHLTVTGTMFKSDSIVFATYVDDTGTGVDGRPMGVTVEDGTVTFYGKGDQEFYFIIIN